MMFQLFRLRLRLPLRQLSRAWSGMLCLVLALLAGQSGLASAADKQLRIATLVPKNSLYHRQLMAIGESWRVAQGAALSTWCTRTAARGRGRDGSAHAHRAAAGRADVGGWPARDRALGGGLAKHALAVQKLGRAGLRARKMRAGMEKNSWTRALWCWPGAMLAGCVFSPKRRRCAQTITRK